MVGRDTDNNSRSFLSDAFGLDAVRKNVLSCESSRVHQAGSKSSQASLLRQAAGTQSCSVCLSSGTEEKVTQGGYSLQTKAHPAPPLMEAAV